MTENAKVIQNIISDLSLWEIDCPNSLSTVVFKHAIELARFLLEMELPSQEDLISELMSLSEGLSKRAKDCDNLSKDDLLQIGGISRLQKKRDSYLKAAEIVDRYLGTIS